MEKLKKALDRARDQKNATVTESRHKKTVSQSPESVDLTKITYTSTKSINIPAEFLREKRVYSGNKNDSIFDQYKVLRTHVLQSLKSNQWNSLAITSPNENCGKTLTSINLAISIAREVNQSVLLVDLDLRRPSILPHFMDEKLPGISDFISEDKELSELLINPGLERLVILPGNESIENSSEMLSSPRVVKLVDELKNRYPNRIVIFDMPPILSCDDVIAFSPYVDALMLVIEEGVTRKDELKRAYELASKSNIVGVVLNKSKETYLAYGY
ncbi:MAG: CpsD/CapB family tyrosine-protein kinase [Candidatus Thiodiazotropha sp.]